MFNKFFFSKIAPFMR